MRVPTVPTISRLSRTHKFAVAGMSTAAVAALTVTGFTGAGGGTTTAAASEQGSLTTGTAHLERDISAQAGTASQRAEEDVAALKKVNAAKKAETAKKADTAKKAGAAKKAALVKKADAAREAAAAQKAAASKKKAQAAAVERAKARETVNRSHKRVAVTAAPKKSVAATGSPQQMARAMMGTAQFQCFSNIVDHESDWNVSATNGSSGAYGLVQALPGSKMASAGSDWRTNPATQIKWGLNYMNERYGSPCGAWSFWQANSWY